MKAISRSNALTNDDRRREQRWPSTPASPHAGKSGSAPAPRASRDERFAAGKRLRDRVPREEHGTWKPPRNRPDPVDLVIASSKGRIAELVPIRYGRMSVSAFTFYRGTALNMASDLAATPNTGVRTHLCGDCHLMNFGAFATPERRMIFDINDFDETLHGPWEWDLKRLAASFVLAAQVERLCRRRPAERRDGVRALVS